MTCNFQYQSQFVNTDNSLQLAQNKNKTYYTLIDWV
jgi:hypothetical protein